MRQSFRAEAAAPGLARRAAAEFAAGEGADTDTLAAVALCVSEAVTNAVLHAYRERVLPGAVELEACRPNGYLCLGRHVRRLPRRRPHGESRTDCTSSCSGFARRSCAS